MSSKSPDKNAISWDDATWILTSSFIVFTMQTGFSLLAAGSLRRQWEVATMIRNCLGPLMTGLTYWIVAYGLSVPISHGIGLFTHKHGLLTIGEFLVQSLSPLMGELFAKFIFRLSLISIATTILSGVTCERITIGGHCILTALCTVTFSLPGYWIWSEEGFLRLMGAVDIAGASTLHLVGGMSGLVATIHLRPRHGRFEKTSERNKSKNKSSFAMSSPTNLLLGALMLWWGWLGLNMGSTFGVSGHKWKYASRAAMITMLASAVGGINGLVISYLTRKKKLDVVLFIVGLLSALVAISAGCTLYQPVESIIVSFIGSSLAIASKQVLFKLGLDDPTDAIAVHLIPGVWSMIAMGLLVGRDSLLKLTYGRAGLLRSGDYSLLIGQCVACATIGLWTALTTTLILSLIGCLVRLRLTPEEEITGADSVEHGITQQSFMDSSLPLSLNYLISLGLVNDYSLNPTVFARTRLRRVVRTMRNSHSFKHVSEEVISAIKEHQVKNLSIAWPALSNK